MSGSSAEPWSNNPNAPQIPYGLHFGEKAYFSGTLMGAIFYGIIIILFFQCMDALLNPIDRTKGGIKWGLVAYTTAMFSFVTIFTTICLDILSISNIDGRKFSGVDGVLDPGPLGYRFSISPKAISVVPNVMFLLNNWLADGFMLYRCYIIYAMNCWVIAFPCLMYLAYLTMGVMLIYFQASEPGSSDWNDVALNFNYPYFSISLAVNVLLTLMIIIRLFLHRKNLQIAIGTRTGASGLYDAVITMLIESSALYAVSALVFVGPWGAEGYVADVFSPILGQTQVIASLLIILRVANKSALTSDTIVSGNITSIRFVSRGKSTGGNATTYDAHPTSSAGTNERASGELCAGAGTEDTIHEVPL